MILLLALGCGSIVTHDTARIVSTHTELTSALTVSKNANPILGVLPLPSFDLVHRRPLGPDADFGLKLLSGAPGVDVRRRLVRRERLDVTLSAAASGAWVPAFGDALGGLGYLNLTTPALGTAALTPRQSLTLAVSPGVRWRTVTASRGGFITDGVNVAVPLVAVGARWEYQGDRRGLAVSVDLLTLPGQGQAPGWAVSLQTVRNRLRARRKVKRAVKQSAKEAR